ncbi:DUF4153 domain-containing protein [Glaciecola sp. 1036]|uniref:DUF4153 domain-containing protein n=1 Tax=Alteromonadaceae TaxID=72275 RepID=UPI003D08334F
MKFNPRFFTFVLFAVQSAVLYYLYVSNEAEVWPATIPWLFVPLVVFSISFPLLWVFVSTQGLQVKALLVSFATSALLAIIGVYTGLQQMPVDILSNDYVTQVLGVTSFIACFKLIMYAQLKLDNQPITFNNLYNVSWQNAVMFAQSAVFTGVLFLILNLNAALFEQVEIGFFSDLLDQAYFNIPVVCLTYGLSLLYFKSHTNLTKALAKILQIIIQFLLPLLAIIAIGFAITLLFTGTGRLWEEGPGSHLLLWLQAITLFFVNAIYANKEQDPPYNLWVHRLILVGIAVLPVYSLLAMYGLIVRIDQYGLTPSRLWGLLVNLFASAFTLSYLVCILLKRDGWVSYKNKVNVYMGMAVFLVCILVNTPFLNFQALSAQSQIDRAYWSDKGIDSLDISYFEWHLGAAGYHALFKLKEQLDSEHQPLISSIERAYLSRRNDEQVDVQQAKTEFQNRIVYWPDREEFPQTLVDKITESHLIKWNGLVNVTIRETDYFLLAYDLTNDGEHEYILLTESNHFRRAYLWFWVAQEEKWSTRYLDVNDANTESKVRLLELIESNQVQKQTPEFDDLVIGDITIKLN